MSGRARRTWVDAFDRVPVGYSAREEVAGTECARSRIRLHAGRMPARGTLSLVRALAARLFAVVSARLRAGVPSVR